VNWSWPNQDYEHLGEIFLPPVIAGDLFMSLVKIASLFQNPIQQLNLYKYKKLDELIFFPLFLVV
jgi:hypothetical protein